MLEILFDLHARDSRKKVHQKPAHAGTTLSRVLIKT